MTRQVTIVCFGTEVGTPPKEQLFKFYQRIALSAEGVSFDKPMINLTWSGHGSAPITSGCWAAKNALIVLK